MYLEKRCFFVFQLKSNILLGLWIWGHYCNMVQRMRSKVKVRGRCQNKNYLKRRGGGGILVQHDLGTIFLCLLAMAWILSQSCWLDLHMLKFFYQWIFFCCWHWCCYSCRFWWWYYWYCLCCTSDCAVSKLLPKFLYLPYQKIDSYQRQWTS